MATDSTWKNTEGPLRIAIYSNGQPAADTFRVVSLSVVKAVNRIGKALLVFEAGDMPRGEIPESDDETFAPGRCIRVCAGYGDREESLFEGIVTSHNVVIARGNCCTLQVGCRDYAFPATLVRKNRVFPKATDKKAITEILGGYAPLSAEVDATAAEYGELVQFYCSDWDFVCSRADVNGLQVITEGTQITVKKPEVSASPVLTVRYGVDVIDFEGMLRAGDQLKEASATAWDAAKQELVTSRGTAAALNDQGNCTPAALAKAIGDPAQELQTVAGIGVEGLKAWAAARLLKTGLSRIQGSFRICGHADVVPGCIVRIEGFGARFDGDVYVGRVEHEIAEGSWTTRIGIGISSEDITERSEVTAPPGSGFLPGISGLHIGKVAKLDGDPAEQQRIQVRIPMLTQGCDTVWARLSGFWASDGYGAFFLPDVGDEVVLGFFNDDPCQPVILGAMYSSARKPPFEIGAPNETRAVVTKSKLKLSFDEKKKSVTVETPGGNRIELSDDAKGICLEDQNGNRIEMNDKGISIQSSKEIVLKAGTDLKCQAGKDVQVDAKVNLNLTALNLTTKAKAEWKGEGMNTKLAGTLMLVAKGGIINLN